MRDRDGNDGQGGTVKHYKIRMLDSGGFYVSPRHNFGTLQELVQHYKGEPRVPDPPPQTGLCPEPSGSWGLAEANGLQPVTVGPPLQLRL